MSLMNRARQYGSFARKPKHEGVAARPRQGNPGLLELIFRLVYELRALYAGRVATSSYYRACPSHGDGDDNTSNQQVQHPYEFNILVHHQQKL
jgi:hypothetical protein